MKKDSLSVSSSAKRMASIYAKRHHLRQSNRGNKLMNNLWIIHEDSMFKKEFYVHESCRLS
jgi:hypothetical protein